MEFSLKTLELIDWLIDGITISAQTPNLAEEAQKVETAKREVEAALIAAGGTPVSVQRGQ